MTISVADQVEVCWADHLQDEAAREARTAEICDLQGTAEALADMERLDQMAADERDAALLEQAKHPGNSVVHLS